jgi:hypothetical protein
MVKHAERKTVMLILKLLYRYMMRCLWATEVLLLPCWDKGFICAREGPARVWDPLSSLFSVAVKRMVREADL